jgi:hypothetical protein
MSSNYVIDSRNRRIYVWTGVVTSILHSVKGVLNRLNQTELATFSILSLMAFFMDFVYLNSIVKPYDKNV